MTLQILYHGNCFDGVVSAAIFTRFDRQQRGGARPVVYRGMAHRRGDPYGPDHDAVLSADENVVVDFRYSPSPRLTWWCDHHVSTFITDEHRAHHEAHPSPRKCFDPSAPSCAGLLCRWLERDHGFDASDLTEHVRWADIIDGARFDSPAQAVELAEPALQLMALLEAAPEPALTDDIITGLAEASIDAVHRRPRVQQALAPVLARQHEVLAAFRAHLVVERGVAFADLSEAPVEGFNKFIPYYLDPAVRYTVVVTHSSSRAKVSVGSNPWSPPRPLVNIAEQCARFGGGGHPVVGAVTLPPAEIDAARRAAAEIREVLARSGG